MHFLLLSNNFTKKQFTLAILISKTMNELAKNGYEKPMYSSAVQHSSAVVQRQLFIKFSAFVKLFLNKRINLEA